MVSIRFLLIVALVLALFIAHYETVAAMVRGWALSVTYNHGFAIPFIAAFFAWQKRGEARVTPAGVWLPGLVVAGVLSALWAVATLVNVQVVAQLATVALVSAIVLTMAGKRQAALFVLPLAYLFFMVPFGKGLVPLLMEWTADFTVGALQLFGIPVIRDGMYFSTSNGNFEVAEACSGVRYLLASLAAGVAFAFLTYTSAKKRVLFILASIIVPIIANGLRAFFIVLLAHFSDMKLAMGIDHFIYGWFFFGIVLFVMFFVGARFADKDIRPETSAVASPGAAARTDSGLAMTLTAGATFLIIAAGAAFVGYRADTPLQPQPSLPAIAVEDAGWRGPLAPAPDWQLDFRGADAHAAGSYAGAVGTVEVRVAAYGEQEQGAELVNEMNRLARGEDWEIIRLGQVETGTAAVPQVRAVRLVRGIRSYLVWYWYQQGTETTSNNYRAKWLEMLAVIDPKPAVVVAIAAAGPEQRARAALQSFMAESAAALRDCGAGVTEAGRCMPAAPTGTTQ